MGDVYVELKRYILIPKHQICWPQKIGRIIVLNEVSNHHVPLPALQPFMEEGNLIGFSQHYHIPWITEFLISNLNHDVRNEIRSCSV